MTDVRTTCPYCGVGCGVIARADGTTIADPDHPANAGRLCSKGSALGATLVDQDRLRVPTIRGEPVTWDQAMDHVAARFRTAIDNHGPDSVAFYLSGQFLTEDYYAANKLMKGFIGSANIDTNSRLCMASSVVGHLRAFGEDIVPGVYDDLEQAELVVLAGSNLAWCHPVLYQRMMAAKANGRIRVVVIDPRRTATTAAADLHLPIAAGGDVALFNGLLAYLRDTDRIDRSWVDHHTTGLDQALMAAAEGLPDLDAVAAECGIDPELLETFYHQFATTERVVTVFSQGVNQASDGSDKANAIINCHLATGRIGRPGMGPFSVTGQPNAMGGREVGGLATTLAAHMRFDREEDRDAAALFWGVPSAPAKRGLTATELFDAVADGRIKAIWIAATNPAASMPDAGKVRDALAACPFVVVADCWPTDTAAFAHVLLPAAGWSEKDGTVTNSERRISRQRAFRPPVGEAKPDWWMFAELGRRLGFPEAFAWTCPAEVFREHAALSAFRNDERRVFDIGALATIDNASYDAMHPVRWPLPAGVAGEGGRLFAQGGFPTPTGKAVMVPTAFRGRPDRGERRFLLNTGRVRDQWHTMTRTGRVPSLIAHADAPCVSLHPADAAGMGTASGDLVRITSDLGQAVLAADVRHGQRRGEVFAPMHWTDQFAAGGPIARVVSRTTDPASFQPRLKATPVDLQRVEVAGHGLLLRETPLDRIDDDTLYWVRVPTGSGHLYRLSCLGPLPAGEALEAFARRLLTPPARADWLEMIDAGRGTLRTAILSEGRMIAALYLARDASRLPAEGAVVPLLGETVDDGRRHSVLSGRKGGAAEGPRICACFGVARDAIRHAAVTHRLRTAAEVGVVLGAGTNCGSCLPEIEEILRDVRVPSG